MANSGLNEHSQTSFLSSYSPSCKMSFNLGKPDLQVLWPEGRQLDTHGSDSTSRSWCHGRVCVIGRFNHLVRRLAVEGAM